MKKDRVRCLRCKGAGTVELPEHLALVLKTVRHGNKTAVRIHASSGLKGIVTVNAVSNSLLDLMNFGLVKRERDGRFWIYRPTQKKRRKTHT